MRKQLIVVCGGILGAVLLHHWWEAHATLFEKDIQPVYWAIFFALAGFPVSIFLQIERTRILLAIPKRNAIVKPILMAHGINVLLPSMLGDLYEIGALSRASGHTKQTVLVRLIHRFGTTLSALLTLAALAIGTASPSLGFPLLVVAIFGPLLVDVATRWWSPKIKIPGNPASPVSQPLGALSTMHHMLLALVQHCCTATGLFFLGITLDQAISPAVAAAMLSLADLITYLPVPLGGIGVHHWFTTSAAHWLGAIPAVVIAVNHAWIIISGFICIGLANWVFDRAK